MHPDFKTKDELIVRFMREEADMKAANNSLAGGESAFLMKTKVNIADLKKRTKCNRCGRIGHSARECRSQRNQTSSAQEEDEVALITSTYSNIFESYQMLFSFGELC